MTRSLNDIYQYGRSLTVNIQVHIHILVDAADNLIGSSQDLHSELLQVVGCSFSCSIKHRISCLSCV